MLCLTDLVSRCQSAFLGTGDALHLVTDFMFRKTGACPSPETLRTRRHLFACQEVKRSSYYKTCRGRDSLLVPYKNNHFNLKNSYKGRNKIWFNIFPL